MTKEKAHKTILQSTNSKLLDRILKVLNWNFEEIYNENLKSDIIINFDGPYIFKLGWINSFNDNMFDKILTNITYHNDFILKSEIILNKIRFKKISHFA